MMARVNPETAQRYVQNIEKVATATLVVAITLIVVSILVGVASSIPQIPFQVDSKLFTQVVVISELSLGFALVILGMAHMWYEPLT